MSDAKYFKNAQNVKERKDMTLAEAIVDALGVELDETKLTPSVLEMMQRLPTIDSTHLNNIEKFFAKIVEDKKLDAADVPTLFLLMQELFLVYNELKVKASTSDVAETLQVLLQILILYKLKDTNILSTEEKESMLELLDSLIKMCTEMIEFKDTVKKSRSFLQGWICGGGAKPPISPAVK